jgi:hypothetical protein
VSFDGAASKMLERAPDDVRSERHRGDAAEVSRLRRLTATAGILAIFAAGVFITWLFIVGLGLPLPQDPIRRKIATTAIQTFGTIVVPYGLVRFWPGLTPGDLGLNSGQLWRSFGLGCLLYAVGLVGFVHCSSDPLIFEHPVRFLKPANATLLTATMSAHAATTDIATRGFILLALVRHSPVWFAICMQNLVWLLGHVYEIQLFTNCLGGPTVPFTQMGLWAAGLFVVLGVLGDVVALRTRNVIGLALGHVVLNLVMVAYIRQL